MSKNHRGIGLRSQPNHARGECPVCRTTGVKVIYEVELDGKKLKVCKFCNAKMKNTARINARKAKAAAANAESVAAAESAPAPESAPAEAPAN